MNHGLADKGVIVRLVAHILVLSFLLLPIPGVAGLECASNASMSGLRGINVSLHTSPSENDFRVMREWGVNLVRLVFHADSDKPQYANVYANNAYDLSPGFLNQLSLTVAHAQKHSIKVVITMMTAPGNVSKRLWEDYHYWDAFDKTWRQIADAFKNNNTVIGYDVLNEPNLVHESANPLTMLRLRTGTWRFPDSWRNTPRDYFGLMTKIATTINQVDSSKLVIVEGVGLWGGGINFNWMEPIAACNVVYSFHMYVPHTYTHDAGKGDDAAMYVSKKQRHLIEQAVKPVVAFAERHSVSIFVGEFGLAWKNENRGASEWMNDVISIFEENKWSWAYWSYSIPFRKPDLLMSNGELSSVAQTERLTSLKAGLLKNAAAIIDEKEVQRE